ncbi:MAG: hypothetical protein JWM31_3144 [Solirubrobacterales bacterium]|nr:hypothetical protein [Solirubrobacterales bacterium]
MLALLRPKPFRGDQVAAGTVVLTLLVLLLNVRMGQWGSGAHLLYTAAAAALVLGMAVAAPAEEGGPPAWHSTLYVCGFVLTLLLLVRLADALGSDGGSGTVTVIGLVLVALATWMSRARDSASGTLLGALTAVGTTAALLDLLASPDGVPGYRWLLVLDVLLLALMALWERVRGPAHGVQLLNAAGLTLLAIAATFAVPLLGLLVLLGTVGGRSGTFSDTPSPSWGWALLVLAGGIGVLSAGAADDERGNVLVGVALLLAFVALAAGGNLVGWPVVLGAGAAALLAVGLRPSTPLPAEPPEAAAGSAPMPLPPVRAVRSVDAD